MPDQNETREKSYRILKIEIKNYKNIKKLTMNFEGESKNLEKHSNVFMGKNGSGKTNVLDAIRLIFDQRKIAKLNCNSIFYKEKKAEIKITVEEETSDENEEETSDENQVFEKFKLEIKKITSQETGIQKIKVILFKEKAPSKWEEIRTNEQDKWIFYNPTYFSFFYIKPFNNFKEIIGDVYFNIYKIAKSGTDEILNETFNKKIEKLSKNQEKEINSNNRYFTNEKYNMDTNFEITKDLFEEMMKKSLIKIARTQKYYSLNSTGAIPPVPFNIDLSEGQYKILSLNLINFYFELIKKNNTKIIIISDEPENHVFNGLQLDILNKIQNNSHYSFISTHSTKIVDKALFQKFYSIKSKEIKTRLFKCSNEEKITFEEFDEDNKMSEKIKPIIIMKQVSKIFFADKIILVEGHSEEFYLNFLAYNTNNFINMKENIVILNTQGRHFKDVVSLLIEIGKDYIVFTDNDVEKIKKCKSHSVNEKCGKECKVNINFSGLNNMISLVHESILKNKTTSEVKKSEWKKYTIIKKSIAQLSDIEQNLEHDKSEDRMKEVLLNFNNKMDEVERINNEMDEAKGIDEARKMNINMKEIYLFLKKHKIITQTIFYKKYKEIFFKNDTGSGFGWTFEDDLNKELSGVEDCKGKSKLNCLGNKILNEKYTSIMDVKTIFTKEIKYNIFNGIFKGKLNNITNAEELSTFLSDHIISLEITKK